MMTDARLLPMLFGMRVPPERIKNSIIEDLHNLANLIDCGEILVTDCRFTIHQEPYKTTASLSLEVGALKHFKEAA